MFPGRRTGTRAGVGGSVCQWFLGQGYRVSRGKGRTADTLGSKVGLPEPAGRTRRSLTEREIPVRRAHDYAPSLNNFSTGTDVVGVGVGDTTTESNFTLGQFRGPEWGPLSLSPPGWSRQNRSRRTRTGPSTTPLHRHRRHRRGPLRHTSHTGLTRIPRATPDPRGPPGVYMYMS